MLDYLFTNPDLAAGIEKTLDSCQLLFKSCRISLPNLHTLAICFNKIKFGIDAINNFAVFHNGSFLANIHPADLTEQDEFHVYRIRLDTTRLTNIGLFTVVDKNDFKTLAMYIYNLADGTYNDEILKTFNTCYELQNYGMAVFYLDLLLYIYPDDMKFKKIKIELIMRLAALSHYRLMLHRISKISKHQEADNAKLPFSPNCKLYEALTDFFQHSSEKDVLEAQPLVLAALRYMASENKISRIVYENFVYSLNINDKKSINLIIDRIYFFADSIDLLKFISPVIANLPAYIAKIVLDRHTPADEAKLRAFGLAQYEVLYGKANLLPARIIVVDQWHFDQNLRDFNFSNKIIISHGHGVEYPLFNKSIPDLFLYTSEKQAYDYQICTSELNAGMLHEIKNRQEFAYTGPWHIGKYLQASSRELSEFRDIIASRLEAEIPSDQKLLVFFDDGMSLTSHIVYALNRLCKKYCVIFKGMPRSPKMQLDKLSSPIIIYPDGFAANELRFAADLIMCGYRSSTALSSIMLGLNFLPFYTRILKYSWDPLHKPIDWRQNIPDISDFKKTDARSKFVAIWPYFFDLLKIEKIIDAIDKPEYMKWYKSTLKHWQKFLFGNYALENAVTLTAEYIVRYAAYGTLGTDSIGFSVKRPSQAAARQS